MAKKIKPPKPIRIGDKPTYTARAIGDASEEGWRWRLEWYVGRHDDTDRTSQLRTAPLGRHITQEAAQRAALAYVAAGRTSGAPKSRPGSVPTVSILARAFLAAVQADPGKAANTKVAYKSHIDRICGRIGDIPTDPPPSWEALDQFRRGLLSDGYMPRTARQDLVVLAAAWTWGLARRLVTGTLPRVVVSVPDHDPVTPAADEVARVMARLDAGRDAGTVPPWVPMACWVLWATGARRSEVATLTVADVRLMLDADPAEERYAEIRFGAHRGASKTGERTVPIADRDLARALAAWIRRLRANGADARLWGVAPRTAEDMSLWLKRACRAEGVPAFGAQAIRRHATDALYEGGADPKAESQLLGHTIQTALKFYRKVRPGALASAVSRSGLGRKAAPAGDVLAFPSGGKKG